MSVKFLPHGSIAVIERFIRSLKEDYLKRLLIPLRMDALRQEIAGYTQWVNGTPPTRAIRSSCAALYAPPKPGQGTPLTRVIRFADRHKKLPIIERRQAA